MRCLQSDALRVVIKSRRDLTANTRRNCEREHAVFLSTGAYHLRPMQCFVGPAEYWLFARCDGLGNGSFKLYFNIINGVRCVRFDVGAASSSTEN